MTIFASVRVQKIKTMAQLVGANNHALRQDETSLSRMRDGAVPGECLAASIAKDSDQRNVVDAFKAFKAETGAKERAGAPIALHLMCVVSPEWIRETGDLHDRNNPRNVQLMQSATDWVETWAGKGSAINVRLDLDEAGGGVVDVFVTPTRESRGKPVISTSKAVKEVQAKHGDKYEYSSLQTDWAAYAKEHLDQRIERGKPVEETGREHVNADIFKEYAEKAVSSEKTRLKAVSDVLIESVERNAVKSSDLDQREAALKLEMEAFQAEKIAAKAELEEAEKQRQILANRRAASRRFMRKAKLERDSNRKKAEKRKIAAKFARFDERLNQEKQDFVVMKQKAEAEFAADQDKMKAEFLNEVNSEERRLIEKERKIDEQNSRLNRQKQALDERDLKSNANERKIEIAYQRLNLEQSALSEREKSIVTREETVKVRSVVLDGKEKAVLMRENAIENKASANRVIDFAAEFSTSLSSGTSFEKIVRNVVEHHVDFSKFKSLESQNLAKNFFGMMTKTAAEIDKMRQRPVFRQDRSTGMSR